MLVALSYGTIGIDDGKGAILKSNTIQAEVNQPIVFDTKTYNIQQKDIITVQRDFGDKTAITNTALTTQHTYTQKGKNVVIQTINLTNNKKLINMITLYINDKKEL